MIVFPQTKSDWCDSDLVACRSGSNCSRVRNLTLKGSRVKQQGDFHGSRRYLGGLTAAAGVVCRLRFLAVWNCKDREPFTGISRCVMHFKAFIVQHLPNNCEMWRFISSKHICIHSLLPICGSKPLYFN